MVTSRGAAAAATWIFRQDRFPRNIHAASAAVPRPASADDPRGFERCLPRRYASGVFDDFEGCDCEVDHGVLVVGFTDDYWIVKNSWGGDWGELAGW